MCDAADALMLEVHERISDRPRAYAEVLELRHTSCPRLSNWKNACSDGQIDYDPGSRVVSVSAKGKTLLGRDT
jgi:hypothetical protein